MEIHLLAIGTRMPEWVNTGYQDYARRLGRDCQLILREIPSPRKSKSENSERVKKLEGAQLISAIPPQAYVIALDERGKNHSTRVLSEKLAGWFESHRRVVILVGGADGLSQECLAESRERWSLSAMTFPHALVRVIVAEQIYRAYSLLNNHPYHRE